MLISRLSKVLLFTFSLLFLYVSLFFFKDQLQFPAFVDEKSFWQTTLAFSNGHFPTLKQLKNYSELSTPLPFVMFGSLEYLFHRGLFAGRLLNLTLSFILIYMIGVPLGRRAKTGILAAIGLLMCPYYLRLSWLMYTDIIGIFFVFWGVWFYLRSRHLLSGLMFTLAIASRQYLLVFPLALGMHEFYTAFKAKSRLSFNLRLAAPFVAALSIVVWFWFFDGIAPGTGILTRKIPLVQQSFWALAPDSSLYFLACIGLYFIIPEWFLFSRKVNAQALFTRKNGYIALGLAILFILFAPNETHGLLIQAAWKLTWNRSLHVFMFFVLAWFACIRFSRINLSFWILLVSTVLMMKAYPWDKYTLPVLVVFWYLKSIGKLDIPDELDSAASSRHLLEHSEATESLVQK
jgi:hypothetical protein